MKPIAIKRNKNTEAARLAAVSIEKIERDETIAEHKRAIAAARADIKRHKLLIRQAKLAYKIGEL